MSFDTVVTVLDTVPQHLPLARHARNKTSFAMASPLSVGVAVQYNLQGCVLRCRGPLNDLGKLVADD